MPLFSSRTELCEDTDFLSAGGPNNFTWNVTRAEADHLIFQHAKVSGAKVFDGVKVNDINFDDITGHPYAASYTQKATGARGTIGLRYLVDASGRAGLINTKYVKNRTYNAALKNVAHWGYWKGTKPYQEGMQKENSPFFEALKGLITTLLFLHFVLKVDSFANQRFIVFLKTRVVGLGIFHSTMERSLLESSWIRNSQYQSGEACAISFPRRTKA